MASNTEKRITAKMVLDSSGYNSSITGINAGIKQTQAAFKLADSEIKAFGSNTKRLGTTQQALRKQLELQTKKVETYKKAIEDTGKKMDANIKERNRLKASLTAANVKYQEAIKLYGKESEEAKKAKAEVDRLTQEYNKKKKAVESNAKSIQTYTTNADKANAQMVKTKRSLNAVNVELEKSKNKWLKAGETMKQHGEKLQGYGEKAKNIGSTLTTHVTMPIAALAAGAAHVGMNFEEGMSKVSAVSGATGSDLEALKSKAEEMGSKTKFSATEASEGLLYMSMAGWKTNEMLAGLPPILNLATAAGAELGTTSDIVTDALTAFNLKAQDAGHFTDVIAAASSNANTDVVMLGESFKYCAPLCGSLGYKAEDCSLALGLMANAGIKGSQSGTALRSIITRLVKPTKESSAAMEKLGIKITDSHGKMKPFEQILQDLRKAFTKLTPAQRGTIAAQLAGQEAMSGLLAIVNAAPGDYAKLKGAITTCDGATQKMADTMQNNAKGAITTMKSALEGAGIKLYETFAPAITDVANKVSELADRFSKLDPETQKMIAKSLMLAATLPVLTRAGGSVISTAGTLFKWGGKLVTMFGGAATAAETAGAAGTTAAAGIGAVTTATEGAAVATGAGGAALSGFGASLAAIAPPAAIAVGVVATVGAGIHHMNKDVIEDTDLFADSMQKTAHQFKDATGTIVNTYTEDTIKISEETKKAVGTYMEVDKNVTDSLNTIAANSDTFTAQAKTAVINNFSEMANHSGIKSQELKNNMVRDFTGLVQSTGDLTEQNKSAIVSKYTSMVLDCTNLTSKQKVDTVNHFKEILKQSTALTEQQKTELVNKYTTMTTEIKNGYDKHYKERIDMLNKFFANNKSLTEKEKAEILQKEKNYNDSMKASTEEYNQKIMDILNRASQKKRSLTADEVKDINMYQENMRQNAVQALSKQEIESKVILERIKSYGTRLTAEQASNIIKNAENQRVKSVDAANKQYLETKAKIEYMRDVTGTVTKDQATKMINEAERQRDQSVKKAEAQKTAIVKKMQEQNGEVMKSINTTDGSIMDKWDKLGNWFKNTPIYRWIKTKTEGGEPGKNWTGTNHWQGGLTFLHERGWELYDLPKGSRVYNHEASEQMVMATAESVAEKVANNVLKNFEGLSNSDGGEKTIIVPVHLDSREIARVTAPAMSEELKSLDNDYSFAYGR
ncbi:phage tail tape measure protein [Clostridium botulinum C/D]|uniref:phage tail tape measure protein n=2 Tax=Clostridium botulinum TaxID=1491 RepID=UPI0002D30709|nr:phage tail tape measure protein [Clostridium botulinum]MCD3212038.1 phage tail tape measure protein [Clostridium botulinum C/D]MCD3214853.1 phage tail tape measure protein [Clostridium botulinum C/D]MCD3228733.1 phage tail tape measure protein [Clostridium botulinum C/D]MCD3237558.1 phage tail tape measure protein [Clostridium botulinum C/D]MCD3243530.1 phage tail tape measure protein [Clostridium botulinum C/D]